MCSSFIQECEKCDAQVKWSSFFPVKKEKNRMTVRKQQGANCVVFSFNLNLKYNPFSTAVQNVFVCV